MDASSDKVWRDCIGNPYKQGLHPAMLTDEGYRVQTVTRFRGMSHQESPVAASVFFDKEYVVNWLLSQVLQKLKPTSYNEFQAVAAEAWRRYKG